MEVIIVILMHIGIAVVTGLLFRFSKKYYLKSDQKDLINNVSKLPDDQK